VATSAENPEKISANEGSMEALIKRRRQLLEELAALGRSPFCVLISASSRRRSRLRYYLARKRLKRKAGGSSGDNTSAMRNVNLLQEVKHSKSQEYKNDS